MSGPSSAREALIAETLGEMAAVLDRMEAVKPTLDEACAAVTRASESLAAQASAVEGRVAAITDTAAALAVKHIARRADELARASADVETRAMETAARKLFREELAPALQRLSRAHVDAEHPHVVLAKAVMGYFAAVIGGSAVTWILALHLMAGCGT